MLNRDLRSVIAIMLVGAISACGASTPQEDLSKGLAYRAEGKANAAVIEFKNALQKDPDLAEARLSLGELYLELGEPDAALKELERALDLGVPSERVLPPLLETKADLGRRQEVLGELEKVELTPRYQALRGQVLLGGGEADRARTDFEAAIEADPTVPRAYLGLAQLALSGPAPDTERATAVLNKGVEAVPASRRMWLVLGEVELNRQHAANASAAFEKAAALPGNDFMPELGLVRVHLLENKPNEAKAIVNGVLARAPKHPLALHLKGLVALSENDLDGAENALLSALSVAQEYPPSLLALANVKYRQGKTNQAESYLRRYVAQDPDNPGPRKALAGLLLESGDASGAVAALQPVVDRLTDGRDLALLGAAYLRAGQLDEAGRTLTAAAAASPDAPEVKTQLALSLAAAGDSAGALAQLDAIVPVSDEIASQADALRVLVNLRSGDLDAALAAANQMVARDATKPLAFHLLGAVRVERKDTAAARAAFEQALKVDPKYTQASLDLARLDRADGKPADARRHLEESIAASSSDIGPMIALAELEYSEGNKDKAQRLLQQARAASTTALVPRLVLGRLALEQRDVRLAQEVSIEAEGIQTDDPQVLLLRARVTAQANDTAELGRYLARLQAYLSLEPADAASYWLPLGDLQRHAGRMDLARDTLQKAITNPATEKAALVSLVQLEIAANSFDKARTHLSRLEKEGADPALVDELGGDIALQSGDVDLATKRYAEAAAAGSRRGVAKLAQTQTYKGSPSEAVKTLESWLKANPADDDAARQLASIRMVSGDRNEAMRQYEALLTRNDGDAVTLNNLAWLYFEIKDARAEPTARKAIALAPNNPEISDTLGWILAHSDSAGAASEAVVLLESAVKGLPDNPSVVYHLAVAQQKAGRRREALQSLERALAMQSFAERDAALLLAQDLKDG
jgi:putative PEP-CTERM system TPR-repeat lipoprotein